jgi:hypothetical protein
MQALGFSPGSPMSRLNRTITRRAGVLFLAGFEIEETGGSMWIPRFVFLSVRLQTGILDKGIFQRRSSLFGGEPMKTIQRIAVVSGGILFPLAATAAWFIVRPWPKTSGKLIVPGLQARVEVIRDRYGMPGIYAENERDLFFSQGYVQAQDRLSRWSSSAGWLWDG